MEITDLKKKILESDEFVIEETKRIQYAYELKQVIRYAVDRKEEVQSESVAEHVYALHLLADYFLPLEDAEHELDWAKIHDMLQYHDIDEIETGDTIGYLKTDEQRAQEAEAVKRVILNFPQHLQSKIRLVIEEYEQQETKEAQLAKALDRIEPMFQQYSENGKKVMDIQKTTREQATRIKKPYLEPFPFMYRFFEVVEEDMEKKGFFH